MRRPWQVWLLFLVCLAMVLPVMAWLTHTALDLDRAEAFAQQQVDLEEAVGSALWQMDAELTLLLAPEIARPSVFYRPFYAVAGSKGEAQLPSPLLMQPSPYVRIHFQVRPDNTWHSPQCPTEALYDLALANDAAPDAIRLSNDRLNQLAAAVRYEDVLDRVPEQKLEGDLLAAAAQWANNTAFMAGPRQGQVVNTILDYNEPVRQQLANIHVNQAPNPEQQDVQAALPANSYLFERNRRVQSRQGSNLEVRNAGLQAAAQQAFFDQRANFNPDVSTLPQFEVEGVSQTLWINSHLLLARRVESSGETLIQGCWLDWRKIREKLLERVAPLLSDARLEPVTDMNQVRFDRILVGLPIQLVVPEPVAVINPFSPIRVSLIVVWCFLLLAMVCLAVLLKGVVALSERRAAFVSAVTHELRTPLTTFRMYTEILSEGMISGADQRHKYLETLKVEADRLSHLVENVLQYARLERGAGRKRREKIGLDSLIDRMATRLADRAAQADMKLSVEADEDTRAAAIATDPAAVEQILFNLIDNACKYAAAAQDRRIHLQVEIGNRNVSILVKDHGPGVSEQEISRLFQPFSKSAQDAANSAPGVGLGLALCRRLAADIGGRLKVNRNSGGAEFALILPR